MEGRSPGKEPQTMFVENFTMITATNVIIAGDNSKNTITTTPETSASGTRPLPDLEISRVPQSGKQPVHNPKSPTLPEGCPPPRKKGGSGSADRNPDFVPVKVAGKDGHGADVVHVVESTKEARIPIQENPEAEKSSPDSIEIEKAEQRPIQESENPKNSITDTTITDGEIMAAGKEARQPIQESPEAKNSSDSREIEKEEQRPVQESENPKNSIKDTTITDEEIMAGDEEVRQPIQESPEAENSSPDSSEIEKEEQRPVQESENPKNSIKETTVEEEITTDDREARQPTQATSEAETLSVDVSELENMKERPAQESENPKKGITETIVTDKEIMAGDKEARQPTQATSEAEKSCADVSKLENMKEKPVQESENPKSSTADTPTMEDELMKEAPVQESEEPKARKDELKDHPERSVRQVFQEGDLKDSASSDAQTKSSEGEALPTQETMPAGKGPFEETGLEVGVKGQPTDEQE